MPDAPGVVGRVVRATRAVGALAAERVGLGRSRDVAKKAPAKKAPAKKAPAKKAAGKSSPRKGAAG